MPKNLGETIIVKIQYLIESSNSLLQLQVSFYPRVGTHSMVVATLDDLGLHTALGGVTALAQLVLWVSSDTTNSFLLDYNEWESTLHSLR